VSERLNILKLFKRFLTTIGSKMSEKNIWRLQMIINYMRIGRWMAVNDFHAPKLASRYAVFDTVIGKVYNKQVLYLEFGSDKGASMKYWSQALKNNKSKLHGFDSFEGLPEDFDSEGYLKKGAFDNKGKIPHIPDERVRFFKGWFDEVLPTYQLPEYEVLIMVLDADLYSSTKCVLNHFRPFIKPGTFIYFDEMNRPDHEPKAFKEFIQESGLSFQLVATDYSLRAAFFECI